MQESSPTLLILGAAGGSGTSGGVGDPHQPCPGPGSMLLIPLPPNHSQSQSNPPEGSSGHVASDPTFMAPLPMLTRVLPLDLRA